MASGMGRRADQARPGRCLFGDEIAIGEAIQQGYRDLVDTGVYKFSDAWFRRDALKTGCRNNREAAMRFVQVEQSDCARRP